MFEEVWSWAGIYRRTQTNIGVKPYQISEGIFKLSEDVKYWENSSMMILEIAAHLHHRLAFIHPFENGNGRHARFYSDLYLYTHNQSFPRWPIELSKDNVHRKEYVKALQEGDRGNISFLMSYMERYLGF